jgi:hypothetical protein
MKLFLQFKGDSKGSHERNTQEEKKSLQNPARMFHVKQFCGCLYEQTARDPQTTVTLWGFIYLSLRGAKRRGNPEKMASDTAT